MSSLSWYLLPGLVCFRLGRRFKSFESQDSRIRVWIIAGKALVFCCIMLNTVRHGRENLPTTECFSVEMFIVFWHQGCAACQLADWLYTSMQELANTADASFCLLQSLRCALAGC